MKVKRVVDIYNQTFHSSIGTISKEAQKNENHEEIKEMQFVNRIKKNLRYTRDVSRKLEVDQEVLMKEENQATKDSPRYKEIVKVIKVSDFDTYVVKSKDNKEHWRQISQLRTFQRGEGKVANFT